MSTVIFIGLLLVDVLEGLRYLNQPPAPIQSQQVLLQYISAPKSGFATTSPSSQVYPTFPPTSGVTTRNNEVYPSFEVVAPKNEQYKLLITSTTTAATTTTSAKPKSKPVVGTAYNYPERGLPLGGCFYNEHGYACCDKSLQHRMEEVADSFLNNGTFHRCNVQVIANDLQKKCEDAFGVDFETIVGIGDYAERIHFRKTLVCKIEVHGRFILAYATPTERQNGSSRIKRHYNDIHEYNF